MAKKTTNNATVKALQSYLASIKGDRNQIFLEWEMAFNTKGATEREPHRHVWGQRELNELYSRSYGGHCGATKRTHTDCHNGEAFQFIVVKRAKTNAHVFYGEGSGNQLIDEIACWDKLAETPEADYLCPILKAFTCKSDKVSAISDKMFDRVLIIAMKASHIGNARRACEDAEALNATYGYIGTPADERLAELQAFAKKMHWRDVLHNTGNSGVIFDYSQNCYKAVFIDYAL